MPHGARFSPAGVARSAGAAPRFRARTAWPATGPAAPRLDDTRRAMAKLRAGATGREGR